MRRSALSSLTLVLALGGCSAGISGSAAFSPSYPDNQVAALTASLADVRRSAAEVASTIAIATSADGQHLLGIDATTGAVRYRIDGTSILPTVAAGSLGLVEEGTRLRIIELETGRDRGHVDLANGAEPYHLIGAAADGLVTAISLTAGSGTGAHSRLVILRNGDVDEDIALERAVGVPAVSGSRIFVPWGYQFLSILDTNGHELARIRLRSGIVDHALADGGQVWFGGASLFHLGPESATETPSGYSPPSLGIDRAPSLMPGAYEVPAPVTSAAYHVRMVFGVDPEHPEGGPSDGVLYLVYYRFVFALDANDATPLWVRTLPGDVVGATAFDGGFRAGCESGEIVTLAAPDGRIVSQVSAGERLLNVAFPRNANVAMHPSAEAVRPTVRAQLVEAVQIEDARLVTAREFALTRIAAIPGDDATGDLGLLCEDERLPQRTRQKACDLLAVRPVGTDYVVSQLARHGSFLDEQPHPQVAALARAAASMHATAAVPGLVEQLEDPRTPVTAIEPIADALLALDATEAAPALLAFLRNYHVDTGEEGMTDALGHVAEAYIRLGGSDAIRNVDAISADTLTPAPAVRQLRDAVARVRASSQRSPSAAATTGTAAAATGTPAAPLPESVTHAMAEPMLAPVRPSLVACLTHETSRPGSARVILVLTRQGVVESVHATPNSVEPCMMEILQPIRFPATRGTGSTRLPFTVTVR